MDLEARVAVLESLVVSLLTIFYPKEEQSAMKERFLWRLVQLMEKGLEERYSNVTVEEAEAMVEYAQELVKAVFGERPEE